MAGTATISWIDQYAGLDPDAFAFIAATGITDDTQKSAINTLVVASKTNGWWTLCNAIYPIVGGTDTAHKYNLKDPRDLDAAFRLTFNGGWTHSSTGALPNGTTGYANTYLIPNTALSLNSTHISFYSRTDNTTGVVDIGCEDTSGLGIITRNGSNKFRTFVNTIVEVTTSNTNAQGYFSASRTASNAVATYKNGGTATTSSQVSTSLVLVEVYVSAFNNNGVAAAFSNRECAFATIGAGIDSTIAALMYTDIQTFQTTLGRQV